MLVLILASRGDAHARQVAGALSARGTEPLVVDPARFASGARLSAVLCGGGTRRGLTVDGRRVDLGALTSVWLRNRRPMPPYATDLWDAVDCPAVPGPPDLAERAARPLVQLLQACRAGFEVPPTLVSADPQKLLEFSAEHGLSERPWRHGDSGTARHWALVAQADLPRRLDLRVVVVADRVFATEIVSTGGQRRVRRHELPDEVGMRCRRLIGGLGLCYGAVNLVLTPDGRYVFVEADPGGGFLWLEESTRMPITEAVCDLLLAPAARFT